MVLNLILQEGLSAGAGFSNLTGGVSHPGLVAHGVAGTLPHTGVMHPPPQYSGVFPISSGTAHGSPFPLGAALVAGHSNAMQGHGGHKKVENRDEM